LHHLIVNRLFWGELNEPRIDKGHTAHQQKHTYKAGSDGQDNQRCPESPVHCRQKERKKEREGEKKVQRNEFAAIGLINTDTKSNKRSPGYLVHLKPWECVSSYSTADLDGLAPLPLAAQQSRIGMNGQSPVGIDLKSEECELLEKGLPIVRSIVYPFLAKTTISQLLHSPSLPAKSLGGTGCSPKETENEGEANIGPVPLVIVPNSRDAKEDEDEGVAHAAPHLHEVFNRCVGLEGDVGFHITLHTQGTRYDSEEGEKSNLVMKQGDIPQLESICLTYHIERKSDAKDIPDCSHHSIQEDGTNVLKKRATWHEIACIQDNGGQEIEEEDITVHNG
ncbi:hypothetical protein L345_11361, partial [Ophiophagus hannah]